MNLLLIARGECGPSGEVSLAGTRAAHLVSVLRVTPGQTVRVGLIDGPMGVGIVERVGGGESAGHVDLRCTFETRVPPRPPVDLLLALPRPKVMRRLWAQLAALGVGRIILTNAARVERHYFDTHVLTPACYEPLLIEGLQQARDTRVPLVSIHRQFRVLVEGELDTLSEATVKWIADPAMGREPEAVRVRAAGAARILLAVGPEGGWNDFERQLLAAKGFQPIDLGPRTLRTDTACIALLAITQLCIRKSH